MALDNKISNILGAAMPEWLKRQLKVRSEGNSRDVRDDDNLRYLMNKTAWVRLISSVNINSKNKSDQASADFKWFEEQLGIKLNEPADLAKRYILYGGTSKYLNNTTQNSFKYELRSGVGEDGAYGMLGEREINEYGYRPMPGITDVRIETQGRLGSVRMATINFRVWDKLQLDVMDTLYFKLGYTMLLEWANTVYYKTTEKGRELTEPELMYSELNAIDPFAKDMTKERIQLEISQNVRQSEGNYDAMLGIVTNFNFSFNQEGGYDCSVKLIALGALGDSIKINNPTQLPEVAKQQLKEYVQILDKIQAEAKAKEEQDALTKQAEIDKQNAENAAAQKSANLLSYSDRLKSIPVKKLKEIDKLYASDRPTTSLKIPQDDKLVPDYIQNISQDTNLFIKKVDKSASWFYNGDVVGLSKFKQLISVDDSDKIEKTTVEVNLDYLDGTIWGMKNAESTVPESKGNYTDLLVYNSKFDINTIINYASTNKFNTLISPEAGYTKGKNYAGQNYGFEPTGIGSVNTSTNSRTNHIQYNYADTLYRVELTIPNIAVAENNKKMSLFVDKPFSDTPDLKLESIAYERFKIRDEIIKVINNGKPWKISTENNSTPAGINYFKGIFVDNIRNTDVNPAKNGRETLGFMLYKDVIIQVPSVTTITKELNTGGEQKINKEGSLNFKFQIGLMITDSALITKISQEGSETLDTEQAKLQEQLAEINNRKKAEPAYSPQDIINAQVEAALKYQSNLELTLKSMQLYALNQVIPTISSDATGGLNSVVKISFDSKLDEFYKSIFKYGIYKNILSDLVNNKVSVPSISEESWIEYYKGLGTTDKLKVAAKYGFSSAILGGHESPNESYEVNYKELMSIYVVPYDPNKSIDGGTKIMYSTYVQLGMLFMILNDMCTIYDTTKTGDASNTNTSATTGSADTQSTPLLYLDYNTETNRCLSTPQQFTTNAFDFLIPFQSTEKGYVSIFPEGTYDEKNNVLQGETPQALFTQTNDDRVSKYIPEFRTLELGAYSGKIMNALVGIDYILDLVKEFALQDGANTVYLKPFLERVLKDMNNYLGNVNVFRLAYTDSSNTYSIVDDQFQPLFPGQEYVKSDSTDDQIPVFGKKSIAKSINIQTEISSKLSNMLAISSNSETKDQASLSTNATSFGFINNSYKDRYIVNKGAPAIDKKAQSASAEKEKSSLRAAAQMFNSAIKSYYSLHPANKPTKDAVYQATNFYISQMSEQTAKDPATRASAMIPVSVAFTTDGISGFYMGQAFTLPPQMLPYTYTQRVTADLSKDQNKIAFATVGVTHEISNNTWQTSIKASMVMIKDEQTFKGSKLGAGVASALAIVNTTRNQNINTGTINNIDFSGPIIDQIVKFVTSGEGLASKIKLDTSTKRGPTGKAYANNNTDPNLILYPYNLEGNIVNGLPGLTIGWGTYLTYRAGPKKGQRILAGDTITAKEADDNLKAELLPLYNAVMEESKRKNVTLTNGQIIALVDLGYNSGLGGMRSSPLWKNAFENIPISPTVFRTYRVPAAFTDSLGRRRQEQLNIYNA